MLRRLLLTLAAMSVAAPIVCAISRPMRPMADFDADKAPMVHDQLND